MTADSHLNSKVDTFKVPLISVIQKIWFPNSFKKLPQFHITYKNGPSWFFIVSTVNNALLICCLQWGILIDTSILIDTLSSFFRKVISLKEAIKSFSQSTPSFAKISTFQAIKVGKLSSIWCTAQLRSRKAIMRKKKQLI